MDIFVLLPKNPTRKEKKKKKGKGRKEKKKRKKVGQTQVILG